MKEITITVLDNCELKQDGNTYTIVEKEKKLTTYEDVARELFCNKNGKYISNRGSIQDVVFGALSFNDANNCTSQKQAKKLLAINKLMNVAKYLNGDWQPDWDNEETKWFIILRNDVFKFGTVFNMQWEGVYFKSEELAKQAIEILGEETIKLALCTDY